MSLSVGRIIDGLYRMNIIVNAWMVAEDSSGSSESIVSYLVRVLEKCILVFFVGKPISISHYSPVQIALSYDTLCSKS